MVGLRVAGGQGACTISRVKARETTAADRAARATTGTEPTKGVRGAAAPGSTTEPIGAMGEGATGPSSAFRGGGLVLLRAVVWPRKEPATETICWRAASLPASVVASLKRLQHWTSSCAREAKADGT